MTESYKESIKQAFLKLETHELTRKVMKKVGDTAQDYQDQPAYLYAERHEDDAISLTLDPSHAAVTSHLSPQEIETSVVRIEAALTAAHIPCKSQVVQAASGDNVAIRNLTLTVPDDQRAIDALKVALRHALTRSARETMKEALSEVDAQFKQIGPVEAELLKKQVMTSLGFSNNADRDFHSH